MNIRRHGTSERSSKVVVHNNVAYLCGQVAADSEQELRSKLKPSCWLK